MRLIGLKQTVKQHASLEHQLKVERHHNQVLSNDVQELTERLEANHRTINDQQREMRKLAEQLRDQRALLAEYTTTKSSWESRWKEQLEWQENEFRQRLQNHLDCIHFLTRQLEKETRGKTTTNDAYGEDLEETDRSTCEGETGSDCISISEVDAEELLGIAALDDEHAVSAQVIG